MLLKSESIVILIFAILIGSDWNNLASCVLAFLAGISLNTGYEWKRDTLSFKGFTIRILYIFGLSVLIYFVWQNYTIQTDIVFAIFGISVFSDVIVTVGYKIGELGIKGYANHLLRGQNDKEKKDE